MNDDFSNFDSLPPKLREEILSIYGRVPPIDPRVDQLILSQARANLLKRKRLRIIGIGAAIASAAAIAVALWPHTPPPLPQTPAPTYAQNDLNHDAQVDMIDVYLLAKAHEPPERVNALALSVVSVKERSNPR